jgi:hypothetical protein
VDPGAAVLLAELDAGDDDGAPARTGRGARSSTFTCREIAGRLTENGAASSFTVASPCSKSRARIARRVGSASAANVWLRASAGLQRLG